MTIRPDLKGSSKAELLSALAEEDSDLAIQKELYFRIYPFKGGFSRESLLYFNKKYYTFDFSKPLSDSRNRANMVRLYAAFMCGKCVRFSLSNDEFSLSNDESNVYIVGEFTNLGIREIREDITPSEILIDTMLQTFLAESDTPVVTTTLNYLRIPMVVSPESFFDVLFLEVFIGRNIGKYKFVNDYIDFEQLDRIMMKDPSRVDDWKTFKKELDGRIDTTIELELFIKAILRNTDGTPIEYSLKGVDPDEETGPYLEPGSYTIHPEFYRVLLMKSD